MASFTQNYLKLESSFDEARSERVTLMGPRLETMDIDGILYFPCRICNRLFKEEKLAVQHLQKCKPRIYLLSKEELTNKKKENEYRDPYEIIPEELDLETQIINNNSINHNRNGSGNKKWTKRHRTYNRPSDMERYPQNQLINYNSKDNNTDPKQNDVRTSVNNVDISSLQSSEIRDIAEEDKEKDTIKETSSEKRPSLNRGKRRNKKLTEQEIAERLKKISEKLKKHKQPEPKDEDDEEEEQHRAIEERLSSLNKDSEVCFFHNEEDSEDKLKGEEDALKPLETDEKADSLGEEMSASLLEAMETSFGEKIVTEIPDGKPQSCRKCSEVFVTAVELLRHQRTSHTYPRIKMAPAEIKKFINLKDRSQCPICGRPITSRYKSSYVKHVETHSWLAQHECPTCKKKFRRRDQMRKHAERHIV